MYIRVAVLTLVIKACMKNSDHFGYIWWLFSGLAPISSLYYKDIRPGNNIKVVIAQLKYMAIHRVSFYRNQIS